MGEQEGRKGRAWEVRLSYALAVSSCYAAVWAACARNEEATLGWTLLTAIAFLLVQTFACSTAAPPRAQFDMRVDLSR